MMSVTDNNSNFAVFTAVKFDSTNDQKMMRP